jgi:hypothetical protein
MNTCTTAKEAADTYRRLVAEGRIRQGLCKGVEEDGTCVTDLVRAIAPEAYYASDVPESIMPRWLVSALTTWFDTGPQEEAIAWGQEMLDELARLDGKVPDRVRSAFALRWTIPVLRPLVREVWGTQFDHVMNVREVAECWGNPGAIEAAVQLARKTYDNLRNPIPPADGRPRFWILSPTQAFCVHELFDHCAMLRIDSDKIAQRAWMLETLEALP